MLKESRLVMMVRSALSPNISVTVSNRFLLVIAEVVWFKRSWLCNYLLLTVIVGLEIMFTTFSCFLRNTHNFSLLQAILRKTLKWCLNLFNSYWHCHFLFQLQCFWTLLCLFKFLSMRIIFRGVSFVLLSILNLWFLILFMS